MIREGDNAPEFTLPTNGGKTASLADFKDRITVLYFYPKDDTSGCTRQAVTFSELYDRFTELGAQIFGVSPDGVESHDSFCQKHNLSIPLIADEEKVLIKAYGVWAQKNMYGRKYMGVDRSTFLIDREGKVIRVWRKVKVPGHCEQVLDAVRELSEKA